MKNLYKALSTLMLSYLFIANANAQMQKATVKMPRDFIVATGFNDYPPVGFTLTQGQNTQFKSVFEEVLKDFSEKNNLKVVYSVNDDYENQIQKTRGGQIDLVLGVYHETKLYDGLDIVFPSMINNPISIIMLPKDAGKIKNLSQLKKMKGGISNKEVLSDYVKEQLVGYDLEHFDSSNAMFEKLFTGKIDYIFASHFFGIVETSKLGLRDKLSFSKQVIWNMPLFFGVSKISPMRQILAGRLATYSDKPENKEKLEAYLRKMIEEIETQNRGVVPPTYSVEQ